MNKRVIIATVLSCLLLNGQTHADSKKWWKYGAIARGTVGVAGTALLIYSLYNIHGDLKHQEKEIRHRSDTAQPEEQALLELEYDKIIEALGGYKRLAWIGVGLEILGASGLALCLYKLYNAPGEGPTAEELLATERKLTKLEKLEKTFIKTKHKKHHRRSTTSNDPHVIPRPPKDLLGSEKIEDIEKKRASEAYLCASYISLVNYLENSGVPIAIERIPTELTKKIGKRGHRKSAHSLLRHLLDLADVGTDDVRRMSKKTKNEKYKHANARLQQTSDFLEEYLFGDPRRALEENTGGFFPVGPKNQNIFSVQERAAIVDATHNNNDRGYIRFPNKIEKETSRKKTKK